LRWHANGDVGICVPRTRSAISCIFQPSQAFRACFWCWHACAYDEQSKLSAIGTLLPYHKHVGVTYLRMFKSVSP
jgi:hypothetical protein